MTAESPFVGPQGADLPAVIANEQARVNPEVMDAPSMLAYEERALLHWAARSGTESAGVIIDAGCFLGGSTLALGQGIRQRHDPTSIPRVHSFDLFEVGEERERVYFDADFPFAVGTPTLDVYERIIASVRDLVEIHRGDIAAGAPWTDPIAVLFVDVAKRWRTNDGVLTRFFPALQPGAIVVQQDLVHFGHPWCAISMELLADHFEFLGFVPFSSAVYRLGKSIAPEQLPLATNHLPLGETLALIDRCADRIGDPAGGYLRLARVILLASAGCFDAARSEAVAISEHPVYRKLPWIDEHVAMSLDYANRAESAQAAGRTIALW